MNSSDSTKRYDPPNTTDPATLEEMRRAKAQQASGLREQLRGVQQEITAIERLQKQHRNRES
jgi:hypothetical protein